MEKKNFKKLNAKYRKYVELKNETRNMLVEYLNDAIIACGGAVEMTGFYKSREEANAVGVDFDDQFPVEICLTDKHNFNHSIYVTRLYKKTGTFYIDGYDYTEGEWIKDWFVTEVFGLYSDLAFFVESVINPAKSEEVEEKTELMKKNDDSVVLVGYQLVDEDDCFPSPFGCWDVFRTIEDAEAYRNECLDPEEYRVIEEWARPKQAKMYHFYARVERSFNKGEIVKIKTVFGNRFVKVLDKADKHPFFNMDKIRIMELNTGDECIMDIVEVDKIYQVVKKSVCPKCGNPLYRGHWSEEDNEPVCLECDK